MKAYIYKDELYPDYELEIDKDCWEPNAEPDDFVDLPMGLITEYTTARQAYLAHRMTVSEAIWAQKKP